MLTIRAPVVGENVAIEPTSRTLTTLSIVVPTVAIAQSVCTLTCALPAVASISTRLRLPSYDEVSHLTGGVRRP